MDRVRGLRGIPIRSSDGVAPPVGGTLVYNAIGTAGYKPKRPVMPGYYDFADYGSVADCNPDTGVGTDNSPEFMALLDTIRAEGNKHTRILMDGWFYFEDTIVITQTVTIEGTGMAEPPPFVPASRSPAGTLLVFPKNVTGVRIRSASALDLPGPPTASAERTSSKDLTIWCKELHDTGDPDTLGDGIYSTVVYDPSG